MKIHNSNVFKKLCLRTTALGPETHDTPQKYCSRVKSNRKWHLHQPNHILYLDEKVL